MILVTVGTQPQAFDRLFEYLSPQIDEDYIVQYGTSAFTNQKCLAFTYSESLDEYMQKADVIITHGGTGTIINALKLKKKIIVVPRRLCFGEHIDDHQLEICEYLKKHQYCFVCETKEEITDALKVISTTKFNEFKSNNIEFNNRLTKMIKEME